MTNFDKFSNDIKSISFAVVNGKPVSCYETPCNTCDLSEEKTDIACSVGKINWLKSEYEEPKITIPDETPINTKLLVSMDGIIWKRRYYAGFKDGIHLAWADGATSWSSEPDVRKTSWEYMKLYKEK